MQATGQAYVSTENAVAPRSSISALRTAKCSEPAAHAMSFCSIGAPAALPVSKRQQDCRCPRFWSLRPKAAALHDFLWPNRLNRYPPATARSQHPAPGTLIRRPRYADPQAPTGRPADPGTPIRGTRYADPRAGLQVPAVPAGPAGSAPSNRKTAKSLQNGYNAPHG